MASPRDLAAEIAACGWWTNLDDDERAIVRQTHAIVEEQPTLLELQLTETAQDQDLLGAMIPWWVAREVGMGDRNIVKLYRGPIDLHQSSACDVWNHEVGHLPGIDFAHHDEDDCLMCSQPQEQTMIPHAFSDTCPICNTFRRLSEARGDLDYLRFQAHRTHRIPMGLGGLIPLSEHRCAEAQAELQRAYELGILQGRVEQAQELNTLILGCRQTLSVQLDPEGVSAADDMVNQAWALAGDLNWWYWAHQRHPEEAWAS